MPIKSGEVLIHRVTGMRGTAAADQDGSATVLLNVQGVLAPYPACEWQPEGAGCAGGFSGVRVRLPARRRLAASP